MSTVATQPPERDDCSYDYQILVTDNVALAGPERITLRLAMEQERSYMYVAAMPSPDVSCTNILRCESDYMRPTDILFLTAEFAAGTTPAFLVSASDPNVAFSVSSSRVAFTGCVGEVYGMDYSDLDLYAFETGVTEVVWDFPSLMGAGDYMNGACSSPLTPPRVLPVLIDVARYYYYYYDFDLYLINGSTALANTERDNYLVRVNSMFDYRTYCNCTLALPNSTETIRASLMVVIVEALTEAALYNNVSLRITEFDRPSSSSGSSNSQLSDGELAGIIVGSLVGWFLLMFGPFIFMFLIFSCGSIGFMLFILCSILFVLALIVIVALIAVLLSPVCFMVLICLCVALTIWSFIELILAAVFSREVVPLESESSADALNDEKTDEGDIDYAQLMEQQVADPDSALHDLNPGLLDHILTE